MSGIEMLDRRPRKEAPLPAFGDHLRPRIFEVEGLGRVNFGVAMNSKKTRWILKSKKIMFWNK